MSSEKPIGRSHGKPGRRKISVIIRVSTLQCIDLNKFNLIDVIFTWHEVIPRILDIILHFRIRHSFAHFRPVILSADWLIRRLQSWACSSLPTLAEFVKPYAEYCYRNSATVRRLVQSPTLQLTIFCGCPSDLRGKGIRVSPAE